MEFSNCFFYKAIPDSEQLHGEAETDLSTSSHFCLGRRNLLGIAPFYGRRSKTDFATLIHFWPKKEVEGPNWQDLSTTQG